MIQRPQSIFLLIIILAEILVLSLLNIWSNVSSEGDILLVTVSEYSINGNLQQYLWISMGLVLISLGLTSFILFSYKNRLRQMLLGMINSMFIAGSVGYLFYIIFKVVPVVETNPSGQYEWGFYALVIALLANMVANRLIRRDEMLVQSSNRMR
jgi:hypothetical protein